MEIEEFFLRFSQPMLHWSVPCWFLIRYRLQSG